jgi:hypothetical protein
MVLSCDGLFTDWLGYTHEDMHGKPFSDLVVQREELDRCDLSAATAAVAYAACHQTKANTDAHTL